MQQVLSSTYLFHGGLVVLVSLLHCLERGTVGQLGVYLLESIHYLLEGFRTDVITDSFQVFLQLLAKAFQRIGRHTVQVTEDLIPVHPFLHFLEVQAGQLVVTFTS